MRWNAERTGLRGVEKGDVFADERRVQVTLDAASDERRAEGERAAGDGAEQHPGKVTVFSIAPIF